MSRQKETTLPNPDPCQMELKKRYVTIVLGCLERGRFLLERYHYSLVRQSTEQVFYNIQKQISCYKICHQRVECLDAKLTCLLSLGIGCLISFRSKKCEIIYLTSRTCVSAATLCHALSIPLTPTETLKYCFLS